MSNYMFVVAHPDDEVLGAGGLISKLVSSDNDVLVVILNADFEKTRKEMFEDIEKSHKVLGNIKKALFSYKNMNFYNENHREIVESIEREIIDFKPDYMFTHFPKDVHTDHQITSKLVQQAARYYQRHPAKSEHTIKALYFMEVRSSTDWSYSCFRPDTYFEIGKKDLKKKILSLLQYKNVVRESPHPRSEDGIKALAIYRGGEIGVDYAESFVTAWRVEK